MGDCKLAREETWLGKKPLVPENFVPSLMVVEEGDLEGEPKALEWPRLGSRAVTSRIRQPRMVRALVNPWKDS